MKNQTMKSGNDRGITTLTENEIEYVTGGEAAQGSGIAAQSPAYVPGDEKPAAK